MASINKENEAKLTQEKLKQLLRYDEHTGLFTWLVRGKGSQVGAVGNLNKSTGYCRVMVYGTSYLAHRLTFFYVTGKWPKHHVDHINGVRSDNSWSNLREATSPENKKNTKLRYDNNSGHTGVWWDKSRGKWVAKIGVDGKQVHLGRFTNKTEAIAARQAANLKYGYHPNHGRP